MRSPDCIKEINSVAGLKCSTGSLTLLWRVCVHLGVYTSVTILGLQMSFMQQDLQQATVTAPKPSKESGLCATVLERITQKENDHRQVKCKLIYNILKSQTKKIKMGK